MQLNVPQRMKAKKYKDKTILHKNVYVNFSELENVIQYRYYFLVSEKSTESKNNHFENIY